MERIKKYGDTLAEMDKNQEIKNCLAYPNDFILQVGGGKIVNYIG
jgi:hypothetical protein